MIRKALRNFNLFLRGNAFSISVVITTLAFLGMFAMLAIQQSKLQEQSDQNKLILTQIKSVTESLSRNAATRTEQINGIDKHLDCIVDFFAQADRASKSITDIDTCELKDTKTGKTHTPAAVAPKSTTTTPSSSQQKGTQTQLPNKGVTSQNNRTPKNPSFFTPITDFLHGIVKAL